MTNQKDTILLVSLVLPPTLVAVLCSLADGFWKAPLAVAGIGLAALVAWKLRAQFQLVSKEQLAHLKETVQKHGPYKTPIAADLDELEVLQYAVSSLAKRASDAARSASASSSQASSLNELIDSLPLGTMICDDNYRIIFVNARTKQLLGYSSDELVGKPLHTIFPSYAERRREDFINDLKTKATGKLLELPVLPKSGNLFPVDLTLSELSGEDGQFVIAGMVDVRERKEVEKLKKEVVAIVSHDLKTPLTTVSANLTMLSEGLGGKLDPNGQQLVSRTEHEIRRLMNLVKDLLDMEKMEAGKFQLMVENLPLTAIVEAAEEAVSGVARRHSIEVDVRVSDVELFMDGERMVQVMVNLLSNAIKFSPDGAKVEVTTSQSPGWLNVLVIDHGRGIPEQYKEVIFEKFRQVTREDGRLAGGTGLGLPICKAIIEQHGGQIGFENTEGGGTTFWFRLPMF